MLSCHWGVARNQFYSSGEAEPLAALKNETSNGAMAFSPAGSLLAAAFKDGTLHLLDTGSSEVPHTWQAYRGRIAGLDFSQDGTILATSSSDGFVKIWGMKRQVAPKNASVLRQNQARANRRFRALAATLVTQVPARRVNSKQEGRNKTIVFDTISVLRYHIAR